MAAELRSEVRRTPIPLATSNERFIFLCSPSLDDSGVEL
jgi:hypothetical protein